MSNLLQVPKTALKTPFRQGTVQDLAKTMLQLSRDGLTRRGNHEEPFLEPLQEIADVSSPACLPASTAGFAAVIVPLKLSSFFYTCSLSDLKR